MKRFKRKDSSTYPAGDRAVNLKLKIISKSDGDTFFKTINDVFFNKDAKIFYYRHTKVAVSIPTGCEKTKIYWEYS